MDEVRQFEKTLDKFERLMRDITYRDEEATTEMRRQWISENLRFDQFCVKTKELFGPSIKSRDLKSIYFKITTNPDARVDWSEVFGYPQNSVNEEETVAGDDTSVFMVTKRTLVGDATGGKKSRDTVQSIKYIQSLDAYITCSQKGVISVWNGKLQLQSFVHIHEPSWVTGCDYLPGVRRVGCCTERSIVLWDNRGKGKSQNIFAMKPLEHSPQCMAVIPSENSKAEDKILFGDDQGYVNLLTVQATDLHPTYIPGHNRKSKSEYSVAEPSKLTVPIQRRKLHDDWVVKVKYFPSLRCFASCSTSSSVSLALGDIDRIFTLNEDPRSVAIPKGITCFDLCAHANIIATGGVDKIIRVWHPHIFSQPTGKLVGHLFTIIDITMNEMDQHIISLCSAGIFRVWDIHTLTCLQVFAGNDMRPGQTHINSMVFDNVYDRLLTGSNVVETWPLTRTVQEVMQVPHTHDRAIVQVVFSKELNQVVSVCTESVIKVWEMETGKLVYSVPDAHGLNVEVTALTLDTSGYRIASGALNGSIKVWDCGTGQLLKTAGNQNSSTYLSITGMVYIKRQHDYFIIACGYNSRLRIYLDTGSGNSLVLLREFSSSPIIVQESNSCNQMRIHGLVVRDLVSSDIFSSTGSLALMGQSGTSHNTEEEKQCLQDIEITCMSLATCDTAVIGCSNGNIILWSVEKSCTEKIFILPKEMEHENQDKSRDDRRVNDVKLLAHKVNKPDAALVKSTTEDIKISDLLMESKNSNISRRSRGSVTEKSMTSETLTEDGSGLEVDKVKSNDEPVENATDTSGARMTESSSMWKRKREDNSMAETVPAMTNPNAKTTMEAFKSILVSAHQDACIRFWDMNGVILRKMTTNIHRLDVHATSLCHNKDVSILVTGDSKGYLAIWNVKHFLENTENEDTNCLKQTICWRGHLRKIVTLVYVDAIKVILSGSVDGSVRLWWGTKGKFVGFFNQHQPFSFPTTEELSGISLLPFDINERPVTMIKRKNMSHNIQPVQKFEYPLVFDNGRWEPFRRSAYVKRKDNVLKSAKNKFFGALMKPKVYNSHLERFIAAEKNSGAVFRSLPIYRIHTPERLKLPIISIRTSEEIYKEDVCGKHSEVGSHHTLAKNAKLQTFNRHGKLELSQNSSFSMGHNSQSTRLSRFSPFPHVSKRTNLPTLLNG